MATFFSLPPEVRQMIYSYELVVGNIHPYAQFCVRFKDAAKDPSVNPSLSLLSTCRLINAESSPLLYSKNMIHLPISALTAKFFEQALHNATRRSWVKSVHLSLRSEDLTEADRLAIYDARSKKLRMNLTHPCWDRESYEEFQLWGKHLHQAYKNGLRDGCWPCLVEPVLDHLALDVLEIDFSKAECPGGCCRMQTSALSAFSTGFAHGMPRKLMILNLNADFYCYAQSYMERWTSQRKDGFLKVCRGVMTNQRILHWIKSDERIDGDWYYESDYDEGNETSSEDLDSVDLYSDDLDSKDRDSEVEDSDESNSGLTPVDWQNWSGGGN